MKATRPLITLSAAVLLGAVPALAQGNSTVTDTARAEAAAAKSDTTQRPAPASVINVFRKTVTAVRPYDQRGVNIFEMPKPDAASFTGPTLDIGAAFAQSFQSLDHSNAAAPRVVGGKDQNKLITLGAGLPLASANLIVNAQLARGIVV